jgi:hypothetical protein
MARKVTPKNDETEVLVKGARRCAFCFYLLGDLNEKLGQLAHIDHDHSNSCEANLAFLCMEHHSLYDAKTSQHKNYTESELKRAKAALEAAIAAKQHFNLPQPPRSIGRRKPKLNVVYNIGQCTWSVGGRMRPDGKMDKMMQIGFWAIITSNADEPLVLLEAYPEGTELEMSNFGQTLPPKRPTRMMIHAFVLPIIGKIGESLRTRFIIKDQYGRVYYTPKGNFRWISSGIEKQPD